MIHIDKILVRPASPETIRFSPLPFKCPRKFSILCCKMLPEQRCKTRRQVEKGKPE